MRKLAGVLLASVVFAGPALAQTSPSGNQVSPSGPNSGAGIPGQPGNKNGPDAKSPSGTSGAGAATQSGSSTQDASKVPGLPGNKSGPPQKMPSDSSK